MNKALIAGFLSLLIALPCFGSQPEKDVPDSLKPWTNWVLRDNPDLQCPHLYNANQHFCAYPAQLQLELNRKGGTFQQRWSVYGRSWIQLPGSSASWPQQVEVNNRQLPVVSHNQHPAIQLEPGQYTIKGRFAWEQPPRSLSLPENAGLVYVTLNGHSILQPDIRKGQLWLTDTASKTRENNRLTLNVYRRLVDAQPFRIITHIELDVAGEQREMRLQGALLSDFTVSQLTSQLPARIDQDGQLRLQLRPGHWETQVVSLRNTPMTSIALDEVSPPWPADEIWVLETQPQLRQIQVTNRNTIDPQQTSLPGDWKQWPTYVMKSGDTLEWKVIKRGDPEPEPDQLRLSRTLWLDFEGDAFTVKDVIQGQLSRQWRLSVTPDVSLGQVTVDGQPQYITRLAEHENEGVELRRGQLNLGADSRIERNGEPLSATGWQSAFNAVEMNLNLPMGYRLFSVSGAQAPLSWVESWTLLDLFLVLITAMACYRLWGPQWGAVALVTLTLIWHEYDAPRLIWLNLIMTIALIKVLNAGRFLKVLTLYRNVVMAILVLITLSFVIQQARTALYPQLEPHNAYYTPVPLQTTVARDELMDMAPEPEMEVDSFSEERKMKSYLSSESGLSKSPKPKRKAEKPVMVDPDAMIQTGPGLPNWNWHRYQVVWDGPVQAGQELDMIIFPPAVQRLLNVLRIVLVVVLIWRLFDRGMTDWRGLMKYIPKRSAAGWLAAPLVLFTLNQPDAHAEFPSQPLLDQLQQHLQKPAECLPSCASIESLEIRLKDDRLQLVARVHASEEVAFPLPVPISKWTPSSVMVDNKPAASLFRQRDHSLWMMPGQGSHELDISGPVSHLSELNIDFQLKPHAITLVLDGWESDIAPDQFHQVQSLGFHRTARDQNKADRLDASNDIPIFAEVTRVIELGLEWNVQTEVRLTAGNALPGTIRIPLLPGESVITDGIVVDNQSAVITFSQSSRRVRWRSTLPVTDQLSLVAASELPLAEIWQLDASPVWHVEYQGIPVIYHQRQGSQWQPEWHPWPGEEVVINITRPAGVKGSTKTIDNSQLILTPGDTLTSSQLRFDLRSSLGGQHAVKLPEGSELMQVSMNGTNLPLRLSGNVLTLPIKPGAQTVEIQWREPRGISTGLYKTSEVDLGTESVNAQIRLYPGQSRWVLFAGGPALGPAVLFWGVFFVILALALGLSRIKDMPLNTWHWLLLGIGLSASSPAVGLLVVGWLLALRTKARMTPLEHTGMFNAYQVLLVILTFMSLAALFFVIQQGLLGTPDMQITGNDSSYYQMQWYTDRSPSMLPAAWVITVPLGAYRLLMLLWAIWLAFALLKWLRWGWDCYSTNGYWKDWSHKSESKKP